MKLDYPAEPVTSRNLNSSATASDGDWSVVDLVQQRLKESSHYYLRTISCEYDSGVLTLRGRVPTFYLKQTVQKLAEKVDGVEHIVNLVDVVNPGGVQ